MWPVVRPSSRVAARTQRHGDCCAVLACCLGSPQRAVDWPASCSMPGTSMAMHMEAGCVRLPGAGAATQPPLQCLNCSLSQPIPC